MGIEPTTFPLSRGMLYELSYRRPKLAVEAGVSPRIKIVFGFRFGYQAPWEGISGSPVSDYRYNREAPH